MPKDLKLFFNPSSIAVIGASNREGKVGYDIVLNLIKNFSGEIYPINPNDPEIQGKKAYTSILKLPQAPDLAVIVIPAEFVPQAVEECGKKGCKNIIIVSAGFKEFNGSGTILEEKIVSIQKKYKLRVLGPNCLGYISAKPQINASFARSFPPIGNIAFMSQSGALGTAVLDMSEAQKVGLSYFVSIGNKSDINELDLLEYFKNHTASKVITMYLESIIDGPEFVRLTSTISKKKPIIILKSGKTEKGQKAVSSHTGSLAGSAQAYSTAFKQSGVIEAEDLGDFFDYAEGLAYQPLPRGKRVAVITNAGGPGILVTDLLPKYNLELAELSAATTTKLQSKLPPCSNTHNPIDVLGDAKADRYVLALETVLKDKNVDSIIVVLTPQKMTEIRETAEAVGKIIKQSNKTVILCFMGEAEIVKNYPIFAKYRLPQFSFPLAAVKVLSTMYRYYQWQQEPIAKAPVNKMLAATKNISLANKILKNKNITEDQAREVLANFSFPLHQAGKAKNEIEAINLGDKIGYPLALKVISPQISHKSDVGGVILNIKNQAELSQGIKKIISSVKNKQPQAKIDGFLVGEMISGLSMIVGLKRDPQFGPMIMLGMGGIYTEILKDITFRLAPFNLAEAKKMISELKIYPILQGTRGEKPLDIEALAALLVKLSDFSMTFPQIQEIDFNPVMVKPKGSGCTIVDTRFMI